MVTHGVSVTAPCRKQSVNDVISSLACPLQMILFPPPAVDRATKNLSKFRRFKSWGGVGRPQLSEIERVSLGGLKSHARETHVNGENSYPNFRCDLPTK